MARSRPIRMPPEATYAMANGLRVMANAARRRQAAPDYVVFTLAGVYPDLAPTRSFLQQRLLPPVTDLFALAHQLRSVGGDPRVRGVVLHLRPLAMPLAQLQTLRDLVLRLREAGKRVVAWSHSLDTAGYYVASAADEIVLQPGTPVAPLGLRRRYAFLADALERAGMAFDVVQISPYKSAGDALARRSMSEEARAMANWLIDADFEEVVRGIADGRGIGIDAARALVDGTPCTDLQALAAGLVDALLGEEDLPDHLADGGTPARLQTWEAARKHVLLPRLPRGGRHVALIRIEGLIVDGESEHPPLVPPVPVPLAAEARAGDLTVVQAARAALEDDDVAAVVVYVDSGGGSATASEAMAAALGRLAARKPVVVAMGAVAASGGYYVATPAHWIVAQPSTVTGSIGVLSGKLVTAGLLDKLRFNRETFTRGAHADLDTGEHAYSPDERARMQGQIARVYAVFTDRVAAARRLDGAALEAVAGGRVWTGRQALAHGLVDELGGLERAFEKARALAGLHPRTMVAPLRMAAPRRAPVPSAAAALAYVADGVRAVQRAGVLCLCPLVRWDAGDGG